MKSIVQLTRPHQWVKNIFVLLPLFFSGSLFHLTALYSSVITMLSFCFIASSVYCFNDIYDVEADRKHNVKCARPIASGQSFYHNRLSFNGVDVGNWCVVDLSFA